MDFLLSENNLLILLIAVIAGALLLWPGITRGKQGSKLVLAQAIDKVNREHGIFIDIRPADQFKTGAIPQARNIPLDTLDSHIGSLPKDKPIILVDAHGRNANSTVSKLHKQGFDKASFLEGGLQSWIEGGMPIKKS